MRLVVAAVAILAIAQAWGIDVARLDRERHRPRDPGDGRADRPDPGRRYRLGPADPARCSPLHRRHRQQRQPALLQSHADPGQHGAEPRRDHAGCHRHRRGAVRTGRQRQRAPGRCRRGRPRHRLRCADAGQGPDHRPVHPGRRHGPRRRRGRSRRQGGRGGGDLDADDHAARLQRRRPHDPLQLDRRRHQHDQGFLVLRLRPGRRLQGGCRPGDRGAARDRQPAPARVALSPADARAAGDRRRRRLPRLPASWSRRAPRCGPASSGRSAASSTGASSDASTSSASSCRCRSRRSSFSGQRRRRTPAAMLPEPMRRAAGEA